MMRVIKNVKISVLEVSPIIIYCEFTFLEIESHPKGKRPATMS